MRANLGVAGPIRSAREVVPADLWDKQVRLLVRDYPYDSVMAARVLGQGYAYLYLLTAMHHRGERLGPAPSKLVDVGVHTIIDVEMKDDGSVMRTAHLITADGWADGWEVDLPLWADAATCGPCHPGNDSH